MNRNIVVGFLAVMLMAALGCSESTLPTAPNNGSLAVFVLTAGTQVPLADAVVEVRLVENGPILRTMRTGADGRVVVNLAEGTYWVVIAPPPGFRLSEAATLRALQVTVGAAANPTITVHFERIP